MSTLQDQPVYQGPASQRAQKDDLLAALAQHRRLFRSTVRDLADEYVAARTTVSELTLGGLLKHVAVVELNWARFIVEGPQPAQSAAGPEAFERHLATFRPEPGDTFASLLAAYDEAAGATDAIIAACDLDASQPLPEAPWFPPGARWTARRTALHLLAELSQHAGHADIIREAIDGAKTMG